MTTLSLLIDDMNRLDTELKRYETKFGVKSSDFYAAISRGDLEEFDALDEYRMEFVAWLSYYKTWLSLDSKYHQKINSTGMTPFPTLITLNYLAHILIISIFHQI